MKPLFEHGAHAHAPEAIVCVEEPYESQSTRRIKALRTFFLSLDEHVIKEKRRINGGKPPGV